MKIAKGFASKLFDVRSEIKNYRFRPIKLKFPTRGTRENFIFNGSFHEAVGFLLAVGQFFGVMPVSGVRGKSPKCLKFRKFSLRFLYCIALCVSFVWIVSLEVFRMTRSRSGFEKTINLVFDLTNFISILFFLELATKWPELMNKWHEVEKFLPQLKFQMEKQKLAYEIKMVSFIIIFVSMAEHLLSITVGAHFANNCPLIQDPIRAYYVANYPQVFLVFEYSGPLGMFAKFLNIVATFVWSYTDLFVIVVSIGLASKFKQINRDLMEVKGQHTYPGFWSEYRLYYREISKLVEAVDKALAKIILISISNNLFFICIQLLRSLEPKPTFAHGFYFWLSLIYLIGRTTAGALYTASVNDESKRPLDVFRSVPRHDWCTEVKRFNEEVANDTIALSGMKFFHLTRRLILSVAGTIVTYELVLIQFRPQDRVTDYDPCHNGTA